MSAYAEWFWSCPECGETNEEPWGDEDAAQNDFERHTEEAHRPNEQDTQL